ncbi:MAG: hypothetical protein LGB67_05320 [Sulfurovum sp.]|nr:hypothetical protein [Sulfurovum sp.]MCB4775635.1 hypothetical protein [Sulfurovum sp.]MCB4781315.1 hypothetical protein [Sulfurovum sp.]
MIRLFRKYGIDKMEGTAISPLTIAPAKMKTKEAMFTDKQSQLLKYNLDGN